MFGTRFQGKVYNFVHADERWKDHVMREVHSQKRWSEQCGYLLQEYENLQKDLLSIGSELEDGKDVEKEEVRDVELRNKNEVKEELTPTTGDTQGRKVGKIPGPLGITQDNARGRKDIVKVLKYPREGLE